MPGPQRIREFLTRLRILPRDERPPLGQYLLKHTPIVLLIFFVTLVAEQFGYFDGQETFALDALLNLHTPPSTATIFLVLIDDEDYETLFHGVSPLDAKTLQTALQDIQRGQPAVIAVDLDTTSPAFAELDWPEAVWTRGASPVVHGSGDRLQQTHSAKALEEIERGPFLGGKGRDLPPDHEGVIETAPVSGPSLFLSDGDGLIRRYRHLYYSPRANPPAEVKGYVESFPWAISRVYAEHLRKTGQEKSEIGQRIDRELKLEARERAEEIVLTFGGSRDRFRRITLRDLKQAAQQSFWESKSPLKDAIVILGGTYAAGRDVYVTPAGPRHGLELVAHAVETSLAHGGIREFHHTLAHILDLVVGFVILLILWRFPGHRAFVMTLAAAATLALLASLLAFRSFAYWFNFAPMVGGLWLHFQWEKQKEQREQLHELKALREEVAKYKPS